MINNCLFDNKAALYIDQGSTWEATFTIFNNDVYVENIITFFNTLTDLPPEAIQALSIMASSSMKKSELLLASVSILQSLGATAEDINTAIATISSETQVIPLLDVEVVCYFRMYKTPTKSLYFNAVANIVDPVNAIVTFTLPPEVTQSMVLTKRHEETQEGFYVIEIRETITGKIHRITEGPCIMKKGAK